MAISMTPMSLDRNQFLTKSVLDDFTEKEKREAAAHGSNADPEKHMDSERIAPVLRHIAMGGIGGMVGYGLADGNDIPKPAGAYVGVLTGAGTSLLATAAAKVIANITRRRKMADQIKSDEGGVVSKYLVPGVADYDYLKREEAAKYDALEKAMGMPKKASAMSLINALVKRAQAAGAEAAAQARERARHSSGGSGATGGLASFGRKFMDMLRGLGRRPDQALQDRAGYYDRQMNIWENDMANQALKDRAGYYDRQMNIWENDMANQALKDRAAYYDHQMTNARPVQSQARAGTAGSK